MAPREPSRVERFAYEVVRRALGVNVCHHDTGELPAMVDALIRFPDGRTGALEVTTIGDPEAMRSESELAKRFSEAWTVAGLRWAWMVHVPAGVHPGELERRLPAVLLRCEAEGIAGRYRHDPQPRWLDWFVEHDVSLTGVSETGRPGAVDVLPDLAMGGAVPNDAGPLIEWIEQVLMVDAVVQRRVTKLLAHPNVEERHLFVRVDESSMDFGPFDVLGFSDYVPDVVPELPADLDGLWLGARWGEPAYWHRPTGWRRASVLGSG